MGVGRGKEGRWRRGGVVSTVSGTTCLPGQGRAWRRGGVMMGCEQLAVSVGE